MVAVIEGEEFKLEDSDKWLSLTIKPGMIIECFLEQIVTQYDSDLWAGFLVTGVSTDTSTPVATLCLEAKSLGCSGANATRDLSSRFNRRQGFIHLCDAVYCTADQEYGLHVTWIKRWTAAAFAPPYMSAAGTRQLNKWLAELESGELEKEDGNGDEAKTGAEPTGGGRERKAVRKGVFPPTAPGSKAAAKANGGKKEGAAEQKRTELRTRLANAKARMEIGWGSELNKGAGMAGHPLTGGEPQLVDSSPEYTQSVLDEEEERELMGKRLQDKVKPDHYVPDALAVHVPSLNKVKKERSTKQPKKRKKSPRKDLEVATRGGTTRGLQTQLVLQAAAAEKGRAAERKKQNKEKDKENPGKALVRILTNFAKGKKDKKDRDKKSKKSKKKKKQKGDPPPTDPSGSNGGSGTSSYNESSDGASEEKESSSSELEAPVRKKAKKNAGSILQKLVEHAQQQLDQTSKVATPNDGSSALTSGVKISSYFAIVVRPQIPNAMNTLREMHHLGHCVDHLRNGELDALGDALASRFIALHQSALDGSWIAAKQMEMYPLDDVSAAGSALVLSARKHARLAAKVQNPEAFAWKGNPKGRGGRGNWNWSDNWSQNPQGKGKGNQKGKGKNKHWSKGNPQNDNNGDAAKSKDKST